jgi:hypothetical protein
MCYSKETSAVTFVYSTALIAWLWKRNYPNDRFMAIFAFSIALMQAVEYLLWSDQKCGALNNAATVAGGLLLVAQPLTLLAAAAYYQTTVIPPGILNALVTMYAAGWIAYFVALVPLGSRPRCTRGGGGGYLNWDFALTGGTDAGILGFFLWMMYVLPFLLLLFMKARSYGVAVFALLLVLMLFSLNKAVIMGRRASDSWRSLWCILCNSLPLGVLILGHVKYGRGG